MSSNDWRTVRFGDVVRNVKIDVDPETSGLERYVAGEHMNTDDLHIRSWGTVGDGYLGPAFHRKFVAGQVLYGSRRTYLRKVAVAHFDGICANTTFVLEPATDELLPELLPFIMQTEAFNKHAVEQSRGSVNPYVNWKDLAWYEFALPPLDEQRRIAELLWAADEAKNTNNLVIQQLEQLKKTLFKVEVSKHSDQWQPIGAYWKLQGGYAFHSSDFAPSGVQLIRIGNCYGRKLDLTREPVFLPEKYLVQYPQFVLYSGDIILSMTGTFGKKDYAFALRIPDNSPPLLLNQRVGRMLPTQENNGLLPEYLLILLHSEYFLNQVYSFGQGSKQANLSSAQIEQITVPIPVPEIQKQLVQTIQKIENEIDNRMAHSKHLNQLMRCLNTYLLTKEVMKDVQRS